MAADARAPRRRRGSRRPLPLIVGLPLLALVISAMYWHSVLASALTPTRPGGSIVAGAPAAAPAAPIVGPVVGHAGLDAADVAAGAAGLVADATDRGASGDRHADGYTDRNADGYTGPAGDAPRSASGAAPVTETAAVVSGAHPAATSQRALAAIGQRAPPRPTV